MTNNIITLLRDEIASAMANVKKCEGAFKGMKTFKSSQPWLAFCAEQLHKAATALREYVEQLATIGEDMHTAYSGMPEQLDLHAVGMDGHPSES